LSSTAELLTDFDTNALSCKELQHRDYPVKRLYMLEAVFGSVHRFHAMVFGGQAISS
jgi:hypothetical protein